MTISSTTVQNTYTPLTDTSVFAIAPIDLADDSKIVVEKNGVELTEGADYSIDATNVTLTSDAVSGDTVVLTRSTPLTQTKDLVNGDPVPVETLEEGLDRIVRQVQEIAGQVQTVDSGLPTPAALEYLRWNAAGTELENYDLGGEVEDLSTDVSSYNASISSLTVRVGNTESDIVDIQAKDTAQDLTLINNSAAIAVLQAASSDHESRVATLESEIDPLQVYYANLVSFLGTKGVEDLTNNDANILTSLAFDGNIYSSIHIDYEISRNTDSNYKTSVGKLYLVCRGNGVWTTERGLQVVDADGVTFTIETETGLISKVTATTDSLAGTSYVGKFKYRIIKFEV